jgi:RsiW-degrading membrane proteinase PrsW (M82 family)
VTNYYLAFWAIIPALLFVSIYRQRTPLAPPLLHSFSAFIVGVISGFLAFGLEWMIEFATPWRITWHRTQHSFWGYSLKQFMEIAPIEEGCKIIAVVALIFYLQRRYTLRASTIFFFTIAVSQGFTAQENWMHSSETSSILEQIISTPVHTMFSAPWGYALGINFSRCFHSDRQRNLIIWAWLISLCFHALVNILSSAWVYPFPLKLLGYALFPVLLWLFWQLEQFFRRSQGKPPIKLISGHTSPMRYWQRGLVFLALNLGGTAIFGLVILARKLEEFKFWQFSNPNVIWFLLGNLWLNIIFGVLAWLIYRYLRYLECQKYNGSPVYFLFFCWFWIPRSRF